MHQRKRRLIRNAEEFFTFCEDVTRRTFFGDETTDHPVMAFFDASGEVSMRSVANEEKAAEMLEEAWQYPVIANAGFLRERDSAIVATYYSRSGEVSEMRIPTFGPPGHRSLGTATRVSPRGGRNIDAAVTVGGRRLP